MAQSSALSRCARSPRPAPARAAVALSVCLGAGVRGRGAQLWGGRGGGRLDGGGPRPPPDQVRGRLFGHLPPRAGEGKGGRKDEARSNGCLTWACRGQHTRAYAMARGRWPAAPANAYPVDAARPRGRPLERNMSIAAPFLVFLLIGGFAAYHQIGR